MAASVTCPGCANTISVADELLGKKVRCKRCQEMFVAMGITVPTAGKATDERIQARSPASGKPRANGQARPVAKSAAKSAPAAKSNQKTLAVVGGAAFLVMAAVAVWALFIRGGEAAPRPTPPVAANPGNPGIKLTEEVPVKEPVEKPTEAKVTPTAVATKEPETTAPAKPAFGPAKLLPGATRFPATISPSTIERVKKAAAFIKCGTQDGSGGTGSGWFAEPGIIITNSHVVGMKEPAEAPPAWLKVVLNSGTQTERVFDAKLLGLDRENDLAVLKIEGDNLPDPVTIARSSDLNEGQRLYTIGFPSPTDVASVVTSIFGDQTQQVGHTVKSRQTHVAGRMGTETGSVKLIQIEGGSDHGNSGGMIVDTTGAVRCIVVSGFEGEQLNFTIPVEYAVYLLQGRILSVIPAQAYEADGKVRQQLTAMVADPMKRIKRVGLDMWTGDANKKIRPASDTAPAPLPGDSPRQTVELAFDTNTPVPIGDAIEAKGEWSVPKLPDGKVYWVQPYYVGFDGQERWGEALPLPMGGIPVQRKPAQLAIKHKAGAEYAVEIDSHLGSGASKAQGSLHLRSRHVRFRINEKTLAVQPDGSAKVQLNYVKLNFKDPDEEKTYRMMYRGLLEAFDGLTADVIVTKSGAIRSPQVNLKKVPVPARPFVERFNMQTVQSLEALALSLPDREVQPGDKWQYSVNQAIALNANLVENGLFHVTCRYVGRRVRDGRDEAVIEFDGKVARAPGESGNALPEAVDPNAPKDKSDKKLLTRGMHGYVRGAALVDLKTGNVSLARSVAELEFQASYGTEMLKFGGGSRVQLNREVTPGALAWDAGKLLPNQELLMNPFVGAPDVSLTAGP